MDDPLFFDDPQGTSFHHDVEDEAVRDTLNTLGSVLARDEKIFRTNVRSFILRKPSDT